MCGRYTLSAPPAKLAEWFDLEEPPPQLSPRYNIAPTQWVAAIPNEPPRAIHRFRWGLVPSWAKDASIGNRMINARAETVAEKPAFRTAFKRRRCLIATDGFYEWRREPDGSKTPLHIHRPDHAPFAFAGLWEEWISPDASPIRTCTIITTTPNAVMAPIHDRMPVILPPERYALWLTPGEMKKDALVPLLVPCPDDWLTATEVQKLVNNPRNDGPECIAPA